MAYTLLQNPAYYGGPGKGNYQKGRDGKKITKVVIHHAAATNFNSIGITFKKPGRMASAHYGVGRDNLVEQYVDEKDMAWHAANESVNLESIGIENINSTGNPTWDVAPETKNTLVELVTDIVKRNPHIGKLVVGQNLFGHKDVARRATACPGQLEAFLPELADRVNAAVAGNPAKPLPPATAPGRKSNQEIANEVKAGQWGNNPQRRDKLVAAGYDYNAIQAIVNGAVGNPPAPIKSNTIIAQEVIAGAWGNNPERKTRLEAAGYDYNAVQAIINGKSGSTAPAPSRPNNDVVADQVIAGAWGSGPDRKNRLSAAGYDYGAIQALVNQKLGAGVVGKKSIDQVANEVLAGAWGNGPERKQRITAAGYDFSAVQSIVNRKLGL